MSYRYSSLVYEFVDGADITTQKIEDFLSENGVANFEVKRVCSDNNYSDFVKIIIPGKEGHSAGGQAKTLGIVGRLGGIGTRPAVTGLVSDGDGAIVTLAAALKMSEMQRRGDFLLGDIILTTHLCPFSPTIKHHPVDLMGTPVPVVVENNNTIFPEMDAIVSVDTTKGNRILNTRGFAITPTVKNGYILRVSEDVLDIMSYVSGQLPLVLPITMQDITPYGNGIYHLNSIMQPATATIAPVLGVALTSQSVVPGCCSGVSRISDIEEVVRFVIELGKNYGLGKLKFYDEDDFKKLKAIYGFDGFSLNV